MRIWFANMTNRSTKLWLLIESCNGDNVTIMCFLGLDSFNDYSALQVTNWFWTLGFAADGKLLGTPLVPLVVTLSALAMLLINLLLARREVEQVRQQTPERVWQDEVERRPELAIAEKKPVSPFAD